MPPKRRQETHRVRSHMPQGNRIKTNTGFRGKMHCKTRTHPNPGPKRVQPTQGQNPNPGFRGTVHRTSSAHSTPGVRRNIHHKKSTKPNPVNARKGPSHKGNNKVNAGKGGVLPNQRRNHNPGKGGVQPKQRRTQNPVNAGKGRSQRRNHNSGKGGVRPKQRRTQNPAHSQLMDKRRKPAQALKIPVTPVRKTMSVVEIMKQKLKGNKKLIVRPKVQRKIKPSASSLPGHRVVELLKKKLKSNRELTVRPRVQRTITPAVTLHPVPVATVATVHAHTPARTVSYKPHYRVHHDYGHMTPCPSQRAPIDSAASEYPQYRVHHDHGHMAPHPSQQAPSYSAASAPSHNIDDTQTGDENIAETTDENLLFLKNYKAVLISKVKNVDGILDYLELSSGKTAIVRAQPTDQAKMRKLLEFTTSKRAAENLLTILCEQEGDVIDDLNDTSDAEDDAEDGGGDDAEDDAENDPEHDNIEQ
ncbi:uncharacterized protein Hap1MRO34_007169 [Clarias gariepinus]|uniref:uncharacterized protein si:dkey-10c21.1 n=1 Tax=Clarias gariepinus TaxID=13013 RepID=UPI00234C42DB|nr:uncharacterized protein si:dkey-10c21.1 [Clarias gariepinus]